MKYLSSPEPRARDIGKRYRRMVSCGTKLGGEVDRSVRMKPSWVSAGAGSRGLWKVKSVTGVAEWERRVMKRVGG